MPAKTSHELRFAASHPADRLVGFPHPGRRSPDQGILGRCREPLSAWAWDRSSPPVHQAMSGSASVSDGPRGLILDITTLLHRKERRRALDALRLAKSRVRPMDGNVFGPTLQVWTSIVVRDRLAHGRTLAESRYLRVFHW